MTGESVCLTLIAPHQIRDDLFDYLSEQTDLVPGYTASDAAEYGSGIRLHTAAERVKGHADQVIVRIVLQDKDAGSLLERLRVSFAGTKLAYWILPIKTAGVID
jgi:hypothetical protein